MAKQRQAFTLMEVILVLAILVVVAAITVPMATGMLIRSQIQAAGEEVRSSLTQARNRAVQERLPYRFAVKDGTNYYRIAPDSMTYWEDGDPMLDEAALDNGVPPLVKESTIDHHVRFASPEGGQASNSSWRTVAIFMPDGTAEQDQRVILSADGYAPVVIQVQASTGSITTAAANHGAPRIRVE